MGKRIVRNDFVDRKAEKERREDCRLVLVSPPHLDGFDLHRRIKDTRNNSIPSLFWNPFSFPSSLLYNGMVEKVFLVETVSPIPSESV